MFLFLPTLRNNKRYIIVSQTMYGQIGQYVNRLFVGLWACLLFGGRGNTGVVCRQYASADRIAGVNMW